MLQEEDVMENIQFQIEFSLETLFISIKDVSKYLVLLMMEKMLHLNLELGSKIEVQKMFVLI